MASEVDTEDEVTFDILCEEDVHPFPEFSRIIENDSLSDIPMLDEEAVQEVAAEIPDDEIISLAFLLIGTVEKALKVCDWVDKKRNVRNSNKNLAQNFLDRWIRIHKNVKNHWHVKLISAFHHISRLYSYYRALNKRHTPILKFHHLDMIQQQLVKYQFYYLDRNRVKLFMVCNNLKKAQAAELCRRLAADEQLQVSTKYDVNRMLEENLLEVLKQNPASDLLLDRVHESLKTMDIAEYNRFFTPIFGRLYGQPAIGASSGRKKLQLSQGRCLIINIEDYEVSKDVNNSYSKRKGTAEDARELEIVWSKYRCHVTVRKNLKKKEMIKELEQFRDRVSAEGKEFGPTYFSVICILSHGRRKNRRDEVIASDNEGIPTDTIIEMLTDSNSCPGMNGLLKIFLIQACRSEESEGDSVEKSDQIESDCHQLKPNISGVKSAFITVYSTMPGDISYRDEVKGTFFIQSICEELDKSGSGDQKLDLLNIFSIANGNTQETLNNTLALVQNGMMTSSTTAMIYLPDPIDPTA